MSIKIYTHKFNALTDTKFAYISLLKGKQSFEYNQKSAKCSLFLNFKKKNNNKNVFFFLYILLETKWIRSTVDIKYLF